MTTRTLVKLDTLCDSTADELHGIERVQSNSFSGVIEEDHEFLDEAYAESSRSSERTSVATEIHRGVLENGRMYPSFGRYEYGMPVDERELDRNGLQHDKFLFLLDQRLFLAPISGSPGRVLDIGTGSGIWAIDMVDMYPAAEVIGTDIAPVQPDWVPPNVQFYVEDAEDSWTFSAGSFDLVFSRETSFAIRDWPNFISQAWTALRPGGWLELSSTYPKTCCDDSSIDLETSYLASMARAYMDIAEGMSTNLAAPQSWARQMEEAGFVDVQEHWIKVPLGVWPKDKYLKQIGALELASLDQGFEAYVIRGWTQVLKRQAEECYALIAEAPREAKDRKKHTYCYLLDNKCSRDKINAYDHLAR